ncbi:integrase core domain-containing protein [Erwinia sp.]
MTIRQGPSIYNTTMESFNGSLRQECLKERRFMSMEDAWCKIVA